MPAISPTPRQRDALLFIQRFQGEHGYSPSIVEIKDGLGLVAKSGVTRLITGLEERGLIRRLHNRARAIEVLREAEVFIRGERYRFLPIQSRARLSSGAAS